jgi:hypothetical protein
MKTTKSPDQASATISTPRRLTGPEIKSLQEEMKQDVLKMQEYLESVGRAQQLRRRLKRADL